MSNPFPPVQKWLGWLQRFLFNVENAGPLPFPQPTIDIGLDFPLDVRRINVTFATIAGTNTTPVFNTDPETHALILHLMSFKTTAGNFPIGESESVNLVLGGLGVPLVGYDPLVAANQHVFPQIGGSWYYPGLGILRGCESIYVPPNSEVDVVHTSVAGGLNVQVLGLVLPRPRSYPLPIPLSN